MATFILQPLTTTLKLRSTGLNLPFIRVEKSRAEPVTIYPLVPYLWCGTRSAIHFMRDDCPACHF
jgi:hypothetical protein